MNLDLATVLRGTGARVLRVEGDQAREGGLDAADLERPFAGVTIDSRKVEPGHLFVALPGERADGHDYVGEAIARGAAGCILSRVPPAVDSPETRYLFLVPDTLEALQGLAKFWRCAHDVEVIGVTGSLGKTTTKEIVASVLGAHLPVLKSEANVNTEIGLPLMLLRLDARHRAAVLEMGMYLPGDIRLLARVARPRIGIVTNVGPNHLERVGSIEGIARAKSELVAELPVDGLAILNGDDPWTRAMARTSGMAKSVLVGYADDCDYRAVEVRVHGLDGTSLTLDAEGTRVHLHTRVPGAHTVHAFLAAVAAARALGMEWPEIQSGVEAATPDTRQRIIRNNDILIIDDSYNAAPMSVAAALELLRATPGTKIAVLGDMLELGSQEEAAHREVGAGAAGVVDWLIGRGPRSRWIVEGAEQGGMPAGRARWVPENEDAVAAVRDIMRNDATPWAVLVKGSRGMRMEEVVNGLVGNR